MPQNTEAEAEQDRYLGYFPTNARFQNAIVTGAVEGENVLTKSHLMNVMKMHQSIETDVSEYEGAKYTFTDLCSVAGGTCATYDPSDKVCSCLLVSVLKMWNYDLDTLDADEDFLATLTQYGTKEDLEGVLGAPVFDSTTGQLLSAQAISISYFLADRSSLEGGSTVDPINEAWEEKVFLANVEGAPEKYSNILLNYISSRSFDDEFGGEVSFVQLFL